MTERTSRTNPFHEWVNLAQPRFGTRVVVCSDDFFAAAERMLHLQDPVFVADKFDDHGKWMDGWESRRKRGPGHDFAIIRLGLPGVIHGVDIDTTHFTGNFPPSASLDACVHAGEIPPADTDWQEILPAVILQGDSHHYLPIRGDGRYTHLRLNIYPDGGIARLRVYGVVRPDSARGDPGEIIDLLALENGGRALACNDEHFGSMHNLVAPGRGVNMGDGWETARRRTPGNDWVILALGSPGRVREIEIDTAHFKGNYPDRASLQAARLEGDSIEGITTRSLDWDTLLPQVKLEMDARHRFRDEVHDIGVISHVRLDIFPDGGVSRLRLFGQAAPR